MFARWKQKRAKEIYFSVKWKEKKLNEEESTTVLKNCREYVIIIKLLKDEITSMENNETKNGKVKYLQIKNGILADYRRNNIRLSGVAEKITDSVLKLKVIRH